MCLFYWGSCWNDLLSQSGDLELAQVPPGHADLLASLYQPQVPEGVLHVQEQHLIAAPEDVVGLDGYCPLHRLVHCGAQLVEAAGEVITGL